MTRFLYDFSGAVYDFVKFIITSLGYFIKGFLIVGIPLFVFAKVLEFIFS